MFSHVRGDRGRVGSANAGINGIDPATIEQVVSVDVDGASLASLRGNEAVIKNRFAEANDIRIGDTFTFRGPNGKATQAEGGRHLHVAEARLAAERDRDPERHLRQGAPRPRDQYAFVNVAGGASDQATTTLKQIYGRDQIAKVETRDGFAADKSKWLSQFLNMIYVLLALSVIVSLFGIVNTLALAVYERTREIGMLRAVGMTRRQTRRMIRHEAMMTSLLGAALGLPVGIGLAALAVQGLSSYGLSLSVPVPSLAIFVVLSLVVGVLGGGAPGAPRRQAQRPGRAAVRIAAPT